MLDIQARVTQQYLMQSLVSVLVDENDFEVAIGLSFKAAQQAINFGQPADSGDN
jgi:hypothetical protein